jgi:hypothetical protein
MDPADSPAVVEDMMAASPDGDTTFTEGEEIKVSLDARREATGVTSLATDE